MAEQNPSVEALGKIAHVLAVHGCKQGENMADWLTVRLSKTRQHEIALHALEEYVQQLSDMCVEYGCHPGELRMDWLKAQLDELQLRRGKA